jgi:hypothetical protein
MTLQWREGLPKHLWGNSISCEISYQQIEIARERPHAVIKRVFGAGRVLVTTVKRVYVKMMVTAFAYNLY